MTQRFGTKKPELSLIRFVVPRRVGSKALFHAWYTFWKVVNWTIWSRRIRDQFACKSKNSSVIVCCMEFLSFSASLHVSGLKFSYKEGICSCESQPVDVTFKIFISKFVLRRKLGLCPLSVEANSSSHNQIAKESLMSFRYLSTKKEENRRKKHG